MYGRGWLQDWVEKDAEVLCWEDQADEQGLHGWMTEVAGGGWGWWWWWWAPAQMLGIFQLRHFCGGDDAPPHNPPMPCTLADVLYLSGQQSCQINFRHHLAPPVPLLLVPVLMVLHQVPHLDSTLQVGGDHWCARTEAVGAARVPDHIFCQYKDPMGVRPPSLPAYCSWHSSAPAEANSDPSQLWRRFYTFLKLEHVSHRLQEILCGLSTQSDSLSSCTCISPALMIQFVKNTSLSFFVFSL